MRGRYVAVLALSACGGLLDRAAIDGGATDGGTDVGVGDDSHVASDAFAGDDGALSDVVDAGNGGWGLAFRPEVDLGLPVDFVDGVQIGDVTDDGRADIVVSTILNGVTGIAVIAQRPDGTLAAPVLYSLANDGWIELGDVTGDGLPDVVGGTANGVSVLPQSGGGAFGSPTLCQAPDGGGGGTAIPGRFDGAPLGVAQLGSDGISLFAQDAGTLSYAASFALPMYWDLMAVGDVTGDGLEDCVGATFSGSVNGTITVAAQSAPLTLATAQTYVYGHDDGGFADFMPSGLAVGDVTGDGLSDVVVSFGGNKPDSHIAVLPQQGGGLGAAVVYPSLDIPETVRVVDMNGDQRLDVVVAHDGWQHVGIYLQQSDGVLAAEQLFPLDTFVGHGPCIAAGDINGDGRPDVVGIASAGANEIALLLSKP